MRTPKETARLIALSRIARGERVNGLPPTNLQRIDAMDEINKLCGDYPPPRIRIVHVGSRTPKKAADGAT